LDARFDIASAATLAIPKDDLLEVSAWQQADIIILGVVI